MTVAPARPDVLTWTEPPGIRPRGTVLVLPGRGEHPGIYERFGRRVAADGYRVTALGDATADERGTRARLGELLATVPDDGAEGPGPAPRVLVGSDTGALFAAALVAEGVPGIDGLVLAGLALTTAGAEPVGWDDELALRTSCPTHRGRLEGDDFVLHGALAVAAPALWRDHARPADVRVPVLGLHGTDDAVSPLDAVRGWYAELPDAELVGIDGGVHDALNDQTHRTAAATVVLFLEHLRRGEGPIARPEVLR